MSKDPRDFTMSHVAASDKFRQPFITKQREVVSNFIVEPTIEARERFRSPYRRSSVYRDPRNRIILKSPETHEIVMTYAAKLVRTLFGDRKREYVKARPRGHEDVEGSTAASRYLRYVFGLPGHFRTLVEATVDMLLFGTSIIEVGYRKEQREMLVRTAQQQVGIEFDEFERLRVPVWDDPVLNVVDVFDFYPDPGHYRLQDMNGAAKRFRMTAMQAIEMGNRGIYNREAVRRAVDAAGRPGKPDHSSITQDSFRAGLDQPRERKSVDEFREMIGFEYAGSVPWEDDQGSSRRVITVLNNVVVRDEPWPWTDPELPWHHMIINPIQGRFYGLSPAEVVRFKQDFVDALLVLLAKAVIRQVHPPIAYDTDAEVDLGAVKAWKPDALIRARGGPRGVGTVNYGADIGSGFNLLSGLTNMMKSGSGAQGAIRGEEGPNREVATAATFRFQSALDRPELAAMILENECLPPIAEAILRRGQQFLPDIAALKDRIGQLPDAAWLGDIMGDFDIEFVGSRVAMTRQEKLQSLDRLIALAGAAIPFAVQVPWDALGEVVIGDWMELNEVAARMSPEVSMGNALLMRELGQGGAGGNNVATRPQQAGLPESQAVGAALAEEPEV